jgi:hypothetical protein
MTDLDPVILETLRQDGVVQTARTCPCGREITMRLEVCAVHAVQVLEVLQGLEKG